MLPLWISIKKSHDYLVNPYVFVYIKLFHQYIGKKYTQLSTLQKNFSKSMMLSIPGKPCITKLLVLGLLITNRISFDNSCYSLRHINIFGGF